MGSASDYQKRAKQCTISEFDAAQSTGRFLARRALTTVRYSIGLYVSVRSLSRGFQSLATN